MPHLLVICNYWPSQENRVSGIFIAHQVAALAQIGHRVSVLILDPPWRQRDFLDFAELGLDTPNVTLHIGRAWRLPHAFATLPGAIWADAFLTGTSIAASIRAMLPKGACFDGCIVHGLRSLGFSTPFWKQSVSQRVLCLVHGVDPVLREKGSSLEVIVRRVEKANVRVAVVGTFLLDHLENLGFNRSQIVTVFNGTEIPEADRVKPPLQQMACRNRIILSVANLTALKGIDDVMRALAIIDSHGTRDWEYRIVGNGPERQRLQRLANSLGIRDRVCFLGRLSHQETLNQMDGCDIFCLPSWGEAFGIVYLEAMARARPIVACDNCGPADFITSGYDGILIPPNSPESLAKAIILLWQNPQHLCDIALAGRDTSLKYSWSRNAESVLGHLGITL